MVILGVFVAVCATSAVAKQFGRRGRFFSIPNEKVEYDGRFAFVRLRYEDSGLGRDPGWAHDYPRAERNLMKIIEEITLLRPHVDGSNIMTMDDPDLFSYPIAYMSEPGFWTMNEAELTGLQNYLRKGGFLIFDDFRDHHWYNFRDQLARVVPGGQLVELDPEHPIFHSFFDVKPGETVGYYGKASFHGIFEDNDRNKRLLLIANYNHDIGELMEFSDTGFVPVDLSNDAYKLGVNYLIYGLTH